MTRVGLLNSVHCEGADGVCHLLLIGHGGSSGEVFWKTRDFSGCQTPTLSSIKPAAIAKSEHPAIDKPK
jgi:hypothetical protein